MRDRLTEAERNALSDDAKAVAAAWFGGMRVGGTSELRFAMVEHRPSPRAQDGLDELRKAGIISREDGASGDVVYRPIKSCFEFMAWAAEKVATDPGLVSFRLVDRITPGKKPLKQAGTITISFSRAALAHDPHDGGSDG